MRRQAAVDPPHPRPRLRPGTRELRFVVRRWTPSAVPGWCLRWCRSASASLVPAPRVPRGLESTPRGARGPQLGETGSVPSGPIRRHHSGALPAPASFRPRPFCLEDSGATTNTRLPALQRLTSDLLGVTCVVDRERRRPEVLASVRPGWNSGRLVSHEPDRVPVVPPARASPAAIPSRSAAYAGKRQ